MKTCKNCGNKIQINKFLDSNESEFCSFKCEDEYEAELDKREEQEN